jgi:hypothetical protein
MRNHTHSVRQIWKVLRHLIAHAIGYRDHTPYARASVAPPLGEKRHLRRRARAQATEAAGTAWPQADTEVGVSRVAEVDRNTVDGMDYDCTRGMNDSCSMAS